MKLEKKVNRLRLVELNKHSVVIVVFLCVSFFTEWSIEREVLHTQCKRLEAQNYNLTRTADQLSLNMGVSIWDHATLCFLQICVLWSFCVSVRAAQCWKSWFCAESFYRPSFIRSWWVRGRKWERSERDCRRSWSTSGGVWHYPAFTGAGAKSTGTRRGDLWHGRSDGSVSDSGGPVTGTRWTGARPLWALKGANPCLVTSLANQLRYLTGSRFNWLPAVFATVAAIHRDHIVWAAPPPSPSLCPVGR